MRIFVAGATGVIGRSLIPQLIDPGHSITAMTRDPDRAEGITSQCAKAAVWESTSQHPRLPSKKWIWRELTERMGHMRN